MRRSVVLAVALVAVAGMVSMVAMLRPAMKSCTIAFDNGAALEVIPVAVTDRQIERGLSGRDDVAPGMLFAWPQAEARAFWMKDTHADLSIAFIDATGRVFQIEDMQAFDETPHVSSSPAQYALELPKGDFERLKIWPGSYASFECL